MKKEIKDIDVHEFMEEIDSAVEDNVIAKKKAARKKAASDVEFKVLAASGCDLILNRKTLRTSKTLVSMPSCSILYIYDEIDGTKETVTDVRQLSHFFQMLKNEDFIVEPGKLVYARNGIEKRFLSDWYTNVCTEKRPSVLYLLKRGLLDLQQLAQVCYYRGFYDEVEQCYERNPNLLSYIFKNIVLEKAYEYADVLIMAQAIYDCAGLDTAKYFVDKVKNTSVLIRTVDREVMKTAITAYNLDPKRFIDYILYDVYKQGKKVFYLQTYIDYLDQSCKYYGKVKEKYPKSLETEHHIISMKLNQKMRLAKSSPRFAEIMSEAEDFSYMNAVDDFRIVMPTDSMELVEEGSCLCHCVASYVDKVIAGDCYVVFMRKKESPETPYLTVEILPDRSVPQIEGMNKRRDLTDEEIEFINRWAKSRHLKITAENAKAVPKKEREVA